MQAVPWLPAHQQLAGWAVSPIARVHLVMPLTSQNCSPDHHLQPLRKLTYFPHLHHPAKVPHMLIMSSYRLARRPNAQLVWCA